MLSFLRSIAMDTFRKKPRSWHVFPFSLSTMAIAFLPKCPLCSAMLLSTFGLGIPSARPWLALVSAALAALPVGFLLQRSLQSGKWSPFALGLSGALGAVLAKLDHAPAVVLPAGARERSGHLRFDTERQR